MLTYNKRLNKTEVLKIIDNNRKSIEQKLLLLPKIENNNLDCGSEVYYLGQQYRLQIISDKQKKVELEDNCVCLYTPNNDYTTKIKIIRQWYSEQAELILSDQYNNYLSKINHWRIEIPNLRYRMMRRRWGSYNKKTNTITLNTELVKAHPQLINYIIAHELCHTLHFNHSTEFYSELSNLHPSWKEEKRELDNLTYKYIG